MCSRSYPTGTGEILSNIFLNGKKEKKDQYFNLEVNLLNDDNIARMMLELDAAEAIGIYVMLLLHLRTKDNYEASCKPLQLKAFARRYDLDLEMTEHVLRGYNPF